MSMSTGVGQKCGRVLLIIILLIILISPGLCLPDEHLKRGTTGLHSALDSGISVSSLIPLA